MEPIPVADECRQPQWLFSKVCGRCWAAQAAWLLSAAGSDRPHGGENPSSPSACSLKHERFGGQLGSTQHLACPHRIERSAWPGSRSRRGPVRVRSRRATAPDEHRAAATQFTQAERAQLARLAEEEQSWNPFTRHTAKKEAAKLRAAQGTPRRGAKPSDARL
jgi:hypothetical protein